MYSIEHSDVPALAAAMVLCAVLVLLAALLTRSGS